ncbi:hypothetical protein BN131_789 [Cronobacter malonaticus 681]|nr:hypothetical protein BN131_789 [Cronobacter malonaticus 681]
MALQDGSPGGGCVPGFISAIIFLLRSFLSPYLFSFIRNNNSHLINK